MADTLERRDGAVEAPPRPETPPPEAARQGDRPAPPRNAAPPPPAAPAQKTPSRRKRIILIGVGALLLVGIVVGVLWYLHARKYASTDDAFVNAHIITISPQVPAEVKAVYVLENHFVHRGDKLVLLQQRNYRTALAQAQAQFLAAEAVSSQNKNSVALTKRTARAAAAEGQSLVAIANAAVATAKSNIVSAQSQQAQAEAKVAAARAGVASARAQVRADRAVEKKPQDLVRYEKLLKTGDVTPQEVESQRAAAESAAAYLSAAQTGVAAAQAKVAQAKAGEATARAAIVAAQAALAEAQARVIRAQAQYAAVNAHVARTRVAVSSGKYSTSQARLSALKAAYAQAKYNMGYTLIRAPVSGWVTRKSVEPGDYVQVGQSLMAIVRPDMWVSANFKETDLTNMRPGQPVSISIDAYPNHTFHGTVNSIQAGTGAKFSLLPPENATGNYVKVVQRVPVKILFNHQPKEKLAPGMSAVPEVRVEP